MKSRLSSTIWTLVVVTGLALVAIIGLAFHAGREANGNSLLDFASLPSAASGGVILAVLLALTVAAFLGWRLTILTILLGALTGSIAGIVVMYRRGRNMQMMLPFGIFLGMGSIVSLLFGSRIISWYASLFR